MGIFMIPSCILQRAQALAILLSLSQTRSAIASCVQLFKIPCQKESCDSQASLSSCFVHCPQAWFLPVAEWTCSDGEQRVQMATGQWTKTSVYMLFDVHSATPVKQRVCREPFVAG